MVGSSNAETEASYGARLRIVHAAVRGRVRLHVPELYRAPALCRAIEQALGAQTGVREVGASERTANLLIVFDRSQSVARLAGQVVNTLRVRAEGVTSASPDLASAPVPPKRAPTAVKRLIRLLVRTHAVHRANLEGEGPQPTGPVDTDWHTLDSRAVLDRLGASASDGLTEEDAERRIARFGPNALPRIPKRSGLAVLAEQFESFPVALLGVSAVVSFATGGALDAAVILGVVLINAGIGYVTESQAERTIDALSQTPPRQVRVRRHGVDLLIAVERVVPGDLLPLSPGAHIAADARLLKTRNLSIDESALTGESMPVRKSAAAPAKLDIPLAERRNMAYGGTQVTGGNGVGVVIGTGLNTELGRIQSMVGRARAPETPMQRQLDQLGTQLALLSGAVCAGVFALGLLRGHGALGMLKSSVSLAVAAVPEGLAAVATTTLALGIKTLRAHQVAVRHLDAVETLGSIQVFCLDKTGTLTHNRMSVVAACIDELLIEIDDHGFTENGRRIDPRERVALWRLLESVSLCSESVPSANEQGRVFNGSPTENALLSCAFCAGVDVAVLRETYPRLRVRHRAEGRPYMHTLHATPSGGRLIAVKGSPAEVLALCSHRLCSGSPTPLNETHRHEIITRNERMAADALRVLGVAYRELGADQPLEPSELVWLGLIGMADPLREGMQELIELYHRAGIQTVMITGDQSATAYAIGKALRLADDQPLRILESTALEKVDEELLAGLVRGVHVFARVSPAHKLQIVQALQRGGKVVAMTGDGINDGPALKAADIGVAMGSTGTDVARSVSDVVLEDDNLHTMAAAISGGRTIYGNIRKAIHFLLATNFTEIEVMLAGIALGLGPPLNPMQLLWINLISDIFPGLALSLEPPEPDVLGRPPRDPDEPIIRPAQLRRMGLESAIITGGTMLSYAYALTRYGEGPRAGTQAFTTLTVGQLLHALSCRSATRGLFEPSSRPANPRLTMALTVSLAAQLLVGLAPGLRKLLGTTPLAPLDVLVAAAGAVGPLLINETLKQALSKERPESTRRGSSHRHGPQEE